MSNSIKISYRNGANTPPESRVMDVALLQRFGGYDIGSRDINHLVLRDNSVCPHHARIELSGNQAFSLVHLPSGRENSVRLNNTWLPVGQKAALRHGDTFVVGGVRLLFEVGNF